VQICAGKGLEGGSSTTRSKGKNGYVRKGKVYGQEKQFGRGLSDKNPKVECLMREGNVDGQFARLQREERGRNLREGDL